MDANTNVNCSEIHNESAPLLNANNLVEKTLNSEKDIDTRSELKFDECYETDEKKGKRREIEIALKSKPKLDVKLWRKLAIKKHGLVNDDLRRKVWPLLLDVDPNLLEDVPSLRELSDHSEYNQVILDVNRSLKRFPPGIPYEQRVALQDQLTVLILRVVIKYPQLRYYQGYHDVAITFLLVVGEVVAFRIMEILSTNHLKECMEPTMEKTSYRLNYIYAILQKADKLVYNHMDSAGVGTMFALPWFLTWFGHSLNRYADVVRLYDFFLATPPLMPLYVAAAVVTYRRNEILLSPCDMASIHCVLTKIPDNLDFEAILITASNYYESYPPEKLEKEVKKRIKKELDQRKRDEIQRNSRNKSPNKWMKIHAFVPHWLMLHYRNKYGIFFATATVLIGIYAYLKATEKEYSFFKSWTS